MRIRNLAFLGAALAIVGVIAWASLGVLRTASADPGSEVPVTRIKRGSVAITITTRGDIQGGNPEMLMAPQVAQEALNVTTLRQPGDLVAAGDTVAEFDTTQQEYNLSEAEADLAEARQKVTQTEADNAATDEETRYAVNAAQLQVDLAKLDVAVNAVYAQIKRHDNDIVLEAAENRLKQAQQDMVNRKTTSAAGLAIQKAAENRAQMMADMARKNIDNMTLKAKSAGYVNIQTNTFGLSFITSGMVLPLIKQGDSVRPGMAVAQLFDLENWEVSANVAELDRGHLEIGQPVNIAVVALAGKTFPGRVKSIGNATGSNWNRKFECRMSLDQASSELRPGMSSKIVITAEKLDNTLWAPSQALFESDGRYRVYLKTPSGFTPREVTLVKRSESQVVLTGVNEGDTVALSNPTEQAKPAAKPESATKALTK
jgi:HlyD family secretion protein